jgi:hypothetical protein
LCYVAVELSNNNAEVDISVLQSGEATAEETISVAEVSSTDQIDKPNCAAGVQEVALAISPEFKKYLELVIGMLHQASQAQVNRVTIILFNFKGFGFNVCLFAE